jgi:hypothetical protein
MPELHTSYSDLLLALVICFCTTAALVFAITFAVGRFSGRRKLRQLIGSQRARLSAVRREMRVGVVSFVWLLVASVIAFGILWWVAANYFGSWVERSDFLADFTTMLLHTWGTLSLDSGSFVPWGCLGAIIFGIIAGGLLGLRVGRTLACKSFDLSTAIY